jgi:HD-GYP domain-containing protein (c-di-GMP phosphodiesterase class II)
MSSDRPYRRAMSHEDTMAQLCTGAGWQFDPEVALAADQMFERKVAA